MILNYRIEDLSCLAKHSKTVSAFNLACIFSYRHDFISFWNAVKWIVPVAVDLKISEIFPHNLLLSFMWPSDKQ